MDYVRILTDEVKYVNTNLIKFNYELDNFQKHSINCINNNENVLVTAHTGSGKTLVAIYAIAHTINNGKKVIYTSPIKALSNQKYKEFKEIFYENKYEINFKEGIKPEVGLMTGDNKINPDADIVIMTTEILRNALYTIKDKDKLKDNYFKENFLDSIGCVIFDEVHYINDKDRGHVWEETIVLLNPNINLVMLSATIDKPEFFANWIGKNKQRIINLIPTSKRIIPLEHFIFFDNKLIKIFDKNEQLCHKNIDELFKEYNIFIKNNPRGINGQNILNKMVEYLIKHNLNQTIFFSFSRINCERYANMVNCELIDHLQRKEIEDLFNKYMNKYEKQYEKLNQYQNIKKLLLKGVAYHHSGLIPILKEIIEIIFQKGLIKILFATETFAVGVNMPTRTIVFTELEKYTSEEKRYLTTSEYKQMSGRAGRRGLDKNGTVIILPIFGLPEKKELLNILLGKIPSIKSKFYLNYGFILKIYQSDTTNFDDFMKKSLYFEDYNNYLNNLHEEYTKIENELLILNQNFNINEDLKNYISFEKFENNLLDSGLSLSKKQLIEKNKLINKIDLNILNKFNQIKLLESNLNELSNDINYYNNYLNIELSKLLNFLFKFNYINNIDDFNYNNITIKGILASQINECNNILLTEIIYQNLLDDLDFCEICAVLSIFIDDVKFEKKSINDIKITKKVSDILYKINSIIKEFELVESDLKILDNYNYGFWNISYDFVEIMYDWCNGIELKELFSKINIYEGNFIKNTLKLYNIITDLKKLLGIIGNIKLIPEIDKIDSAIIRDIVSINSLYL